MSEIIINEVITTVDLTVTEIITTQTIVINEAVGILEIQAGTNVTVDNTNPLRPIVSASGGGGGGSTWGSIAGTLSNQEDLQNALDDKLDADATTADVEPSTNRNYQTDLQNMYNDATSSIQGQIDGIIATSPELITTKITTGYRNSAGTNSSVITNSSSINCTGIINCKPLDKFVIQGITTSASLNTLAKVFNNLGNYVEVISGLSLVSDGTAYILTIGSGITIDNFGVNYNIIDKDTISIKKGNSLTEVLNNKYIREEIVDIYIPKKVSYLENDSNFIGETEIEILKSNVQIIDNTATTQGEYGFSIGVVSGGFSINWTGVIFLSYSHDPSTSANRYANLIASSGTRTISLTSTNTCCYIKKSDFTSATAEIIPVYYCRWGNDLLKDPDNFVLIYKGKSTKLKDASGPFADFVRNTMNESRISTLEANLPSGLNFTKSDNESQNLFLRGNATKDYTTNKKYGIITAGQSNTDGRVPQANAPVWLNQLNPELLGVNMFNRTTKTFGAFKLGTLTGAQTQGTTLWAYDMVAYYLLQQYLSDDIYVIKTTQGGTAIDPLGSNGGGYWNAYSERVPSGTILIESFKKQILDALSASSDFEIKAFIWHQGEGDSGTIPSNNYYQNFKNVIAYVRGVVGNPTLPIVFSSISTVSSQYSLTVKNAQIQIASEDPYAYFIDNTNLALLDSYHFNAASSETIGTNYFNILKTF